MPVKRPVVWLLPLLFIAAAVALTLWYSASLSVTATALPADVGSKPPDIAFAMLDDPAQKRGPADWRGQKVFVNFFASWCLPCRAEHPQLMQLRAAVKTPVLGIAHYDRSAATKKLLADHGNPYSLVLEDPLGRGGKSWGLNGVPESFILDADGTVVWNHRGPVTAALLEKEILPLLR